MDPPHQWSWIIKEDKMDKTSLLKNSPQMKNFTKFCEKHDLCYVIVAMDKNQESNVLCQGDLEAAKACSILQKMSPSPSKQQNVIKDLPPLPTNYPELFKNQQETINLANKILKLYIGETPIGEGKLH